MKKLCRLFPVSFAVIGLLVGSAVASAAIDFSPGGNVPVQVKMAISRFSVAGSQTEGFNLVSSPSSPSNDFVSFPLPDDWVMDVGFSGVGAHQTNSHQSLSGSFMLSDAGDFALDFDNGYFGNPEPTSVGGRFTLTLSGLLPLDGSVLSDFNYITGTEWFYELMTFDFSQAGSGTVVITGNIPVDSASISGYFTSTAIPEPATVALMLAAAAGGVVAWRRKRTA